MIVFQFASVIVWYLVRRPSGIDISAISGVELAAALVLGSYGQLLNLAIYKAIGRVGVYYGSSPISFYSKLVLFDLLLSIYKHFISCT